MKISVIKIDSTLHVIGEHSQEELLHLVNGKEYVADIKMNRHPSFHRKAFALFKMLFDNQEHYDDFDVYRQKLQMKGGHFRTIVNTDGSVEFWPKSINFESMSQNEFEKLFQKIITFAVHEYGHEEGFLWQIMGFS